MASEDSLEFLAMPGNSMMSLSGQRPGEYAGITSAMSAMPSVTILGCRPGLPPSTPPGNVSILMIPAPSALTASDQGLMTLSNVGAWGGMNAESLSVTS